MEGRMDRWEKERGHSVWLKNRCGLQRAIEESASLPRIFHPRSFNKGFLFRSRTRQFTSRLLSSPLETFIHTGDLCLVLLFWLHVWHRAAITCRQTHTCRDGKTCLTNKRIRRNSMKVKSCDSNNKQLARKHTEKTSHWNCTMCLPLWHRHYFWA